MSLGQGSRKVLSAEVFKFLQPLNRLLKRSFSIKAWRFAIQFPSGPSNQQMLVHQSSSELVGIDRSGHRIDCFHSFLDSFNIEQQSSRSDRNKGTITAAL